MKEQVNSKKRGSSKNNKNKKRNDESVDIPSSVDSIATDAAVIAPTGLKTRTRRREMIVPLSQRAKLAAVNSSTKHLIRKPTGKNSSNSP